MTGLGLWTLRGPWFGWSRDSCSYSRRCMSRRNLRWQFWRRRVLIPGRGHAAAGRRKPADHLPRDSIFSGEKDVTISTERKKLTIFFSDIKDFTAATERLQPEQFTVLLNEYFTEMSNIALTRRHDRQILVPLP